MGYTTPFFFFSPQRQHTKFWSSLKIHITKLAVLNWQITVILSCECLLWQSQRPHPSAAPETARAHEAPQTCPRTPRASLLSPEQPQLLKFHHPSLHSPAKTKARNFVSIRHVPVPLLRYFESNGGGGLNHTTNKQIKPLTIFGVSLYCQCNYNSSTQRKVHKCY